MGEERIEKEKIAVETVRRRCLLLAHETKSKGGGGGGIGKTRVDGERKPSTSNR